MNMLRDYIDHLRQRGVQGEVVATHITAVTRFLYWLVQSYGPPSDAGRITEAMVNQYVDKEPDAGRLVVDFYQWLKEAA